MPLEETDYKTLEIRYALVKRRTWLRGPATLIGSALGFLVLTGVVSWQGAKNAIESEIGKEALDQLIEYEKQGGVHLSNLVEQSTAVRNALLSGPSLVAWGDLNLHLDDWSHNEWNRHDDPNGFPYAEFSKYVPLEGYEPSEVEVIVLIAGFSLRPKSVGQLSCKVRSKHGSRNGLTGHFAEIVLTQPEKFLSVDACYMVVLGRK